MRILVRLLATLVVAGATPFPASAQQAAMDRAAAATARGDLARAHLIYDSLLAERPGDVRVRVARGHVLGWRGDYAAALADFNTAVAADSTDLSAWLGAGYVLAWTHRWERADAAFARAQALAPSAVEPRKGRAWVALWRGDAAAAEERFRALEAEFPGDGELPLGRGHASAARGHRRAARTAYSRAVQLGRADAARSLEATRFMPAPVEITVLGGYTRFAGGAFDGTDRFALRSAQLAVTPVPALRLWASYDDGLALDNASLAAAGTHVPWYSGGAFVTWGGRFGTKLEGGWRDLDGVGQWTAGLEQVVTLPTGVSLKALGWLGRRSDARTEWVAGLGVGVPVGARLRVDLTGFTSGNGLPDEDGFRALLGAGYRLPTGIELTGGVAAGRTAVDPTRTGSVGEGFLGLSLPVAAHRVRLLARHQLMEDGEDFTALAFGFTLGLLER